MPATIRPTSATAQSQEPSAIRHEPSARNHKPTFSIAVRSLVRHVLRSGDLRFDFMGSVRAIEGIRAHQQIQRRRPGHYQAEVPVSRTVEGDKYRLCVSGRIDGVLVEPSTAVVEEIKTTRRSLEEVEENPNPIHWAQAQCYAYLWAVQASMPRVDVHLTYMNLDNGKVKTLERHFSIEELEQFFDDLIHRYMAWVTRLANWVCLRDAAIDQLQFPFKHYRAGQREMAIAVYRTIRQKGHLLAQAATGIGKTMAVLFPAIKALGEKMGEKVVFLTARTTGRLAAQDALYILMGAGLRIKSVTLTAKDKICFHPQSACVPEECECARGYYDRIDDALSAALDHDAFTRDIIEQTAAEHRVCPFEFSLELVNWADCVICDYNYAFAPGVMLQRLFGDEGGDHTVLVDEAHNLVDRSREMFSAQLDKRPILALRRKIKDDLPVVYRNLGRVNAWMARRRRECLEAGGTQVTHELPMGLLERIRGVLAAAEEWLSLNLRTDFGEDLLKLFFDMLRFVRVAEAFDPHYVVIDEAAGEELRIKLFCIDPSHQLEATWQRCRSAVLFSATLTPAGYFQAALGCDTQARRLDLPSPFPPSNLAVYVADEISTLYRERKDSAPSVVRIIADLVCRRKGHYLLYFPSYEYLEMIHRRFVQDCREVHTLVQTPDMDEGQREAFLDRYKQAVPETLVGFAVMGGIFGEGIDLRGERLTGAVIVGVGLPGICLERDLIRDYFNREKGAGFEFAYQYPGINRVLQAAGRVIRSEEDRGVILLIDQRYRQPRYWSLLPGHWNPSRFFHGRSLNEGKRSVRNEP